MTILGIGLFEVVIIVIVALVFVGPERLPELMRTAGSGMKRVKQLAAQLQEQARAELGDDYEMVQTHVRTLRELDPRRQLSGLAGSLLDDPARPAARPVASPHAATNAVAQARIQAMTSAALDSALLDPPLEAAEARADAVLSSAGLL